jgi:hypothetical protein
MAARPAHAQPSRDFMVKLVSRGFFRALIEGETETLLPLCAERVNLDGQVVRSREALKKRFQQMSRRARRLGIRLKKIQVISYAEAVERFGAPPRRLQSEVRPNTMVALARFNSRGAVAVLKRSGTFWRVVALTD